MRCYGRRVLWCALWLAGAVALAEEPQEAPPPPDEAPTVDASDLELGAAVAELPPQIAALGHDGMMERYVGANYTRIPSGSKLLGEAVDVLRWSCSGADPMLCEALGASLSEMQGRKPEYAEAFEATLDGCDLAVKEACAVSLRFHPAPSTKHMALPTVRERLLLGCSDQLAVTCVELANKLPKDERDKKLRRGCDLGDGESCAALAKRVPAERDELLDRACEVGSGAACWTRYRERHGGGLPASGSTQWTAAKQACDAGSGRACRLIGQAHLRADAAQRDEVASLSAFEQGCDQGDVTSCRRAARAYFRGVGTGRNLAKSIYYRRGRAQVLTPYRFTARSSALHGLGGAAEIVLPIRYGPGVSLNLGAGWSPMRALTYGALAELLELVTNIRRPNAWGLDLMTRIYPRHEARDVFVGFGLGMTRMYDATGDWFAERDRPDTTGQLGFVPKVTVGGVRQTGNVFVSLSGGLGYLATPAFRELSLLGSSLGGLAPELVLEIGFGVR